jgi:hypothetical protein
MRGSPGMNAFTDAPLALVPAKAEVVALAAAPQ